jgi:hypothetical protein
MIFLIEGNELVGRFPDESDEPYRVARDGAVIIDTSSGVMVDWKRDLARAAMELSDTSLSCERAAVLAIPGAAETVAAMRRLYDEIDARLK